VRRVRLQYVWGVWPGAKAWTRRFSVSTVAFFARGKAPLLSAPFPSRVNSPFDDPQLFANPYLLSVLSAELGDDFVLGAFGVVHRYNKASIRSYAAQPASSQKLTRSDLHQVPRSAIRRRLWNIQHAQRVLRGKH
jgi:hypothetical protein